MKSISVTGVKIRTEKYSKVFTPKWCLVQEIMAPLPQRLGMAGPIPMFCAFLPSFEPDPGGTGKPTHEASPTSYHQQGSSLSESQPCHDANNS